jgi:hypothetical protein
MNGPETKKELICMRLTEMKRVHPKMDTTHKCSKCGERVGVYPSGQRVLVAFGEDAIDIVCSVCTGNTWTAPAVFQLAPGALQEKGESVPNPNYRAKTK